MAGSPWEVQRSPKALDLWFLLPSSAVGSSFPRWIIDFHLQDMGDLIHSRVITIFWSDGEAGDFILFETGPPYVVEAGL